MQDTIWEYMGMHYCRDTQENMRRLEDIRDTGNTQRDGDAQRYTW